MNVQDSGICIEYSFEGALNDITHTIYRPGNIKMLEVYMRPCFIDCVREEYEAKRCWISNIYVKAKAEDGTQMELRIGNQADYDIEVQLFAKGDV